MINVSIYVTGIVWQGNTHTTVVLVKLDEVQQVALMTVTVVLGTEITKLQP